MRSGMRLVIGLGTAVTVGLLTALPAAAAPTDDTTVTFEILSGTLDVVAPATADLATGTPGTDITGQLGTVAITDGRASADASWIASIVSTDFTTGGATPSETVLASEIDYWSGPATATTGNGTFTPGQPTAGDAEPLDGTAPVEAFTHTGGTGNNTTNWNPTLVVHAPLDDQAGVYTGTVTHSVA